MNTESRTPFLHLRKVRGILITLLLLVFAALRGNAQITGVIDGIYYINGLTVAEGWACDYGHPESVGVHLYSGGPAGTGTFVNAAAANLPSDGAVAAACGSTGTNYRFQVEIGNYQAQNVGKTIYVHGISNTGGPNYTLYNSGVFIFPDSIYGTMKDQYGTDNQIQVHVSSKYAGAIDHVYWHAQDFVDDLDHGRQFQMAAQFHGYGECYNPTEAGSLWDQDKPDSSSLLFYLSTYDNFLITRNYPAFWLRGPYSDYNDWSSSSPYCTDELYLGPVSGPPDNNARNQAVRSNYRFDKNVTIGFYPSPPYAPISNVVDMTCRFYIPSAGNDNYTTHFDGGAYTSGNGMQLESPSGAMPSSFTNVYEYDLNGHLNQVFTCVDCTNPANNGNPCCQTWHRLPVVLEDPGTGNAIGLYSPDILNSSSAWFGGSNAYVNGSYAAGWPLSSWSFIYRDYGAVPQGAVISHKAYLAFGSSKEQVRDVLANLHYYFKNTGQVP